MSQLLYQEHAISLLNTKHMQISFFNMYRKGYRYRSSVKSEFSPSLRKASTPNYYQRKGRTIQQSPLYMYNAPTTVISRKYLDKLYKLLKDYKYPLSPSPSPTPVNLPDPFVYNIEKSIGELFPGTNTESHQFTAADLTALMADQNTPNLPTGYHYRYQLIGLGFYCTNNSQGTAQFFIDWYSNLIGGVLSINSFSIFIKSVDTAFVNVPYRQIFAAPNGNQIQITRAATASGGSVSVTYQNVGNKDPDPSDNGNYPLIDTDAGEHDLYYGYLKINPTNYYYNNSPSFILNVVCIPTPD